MLRSKDGSTRMKRHANSWTSCLEWDPRNGGTAFCWSASSGLHLDFTENLERESGIGVASEF